MIPSSEVYDEYLSVLTSNEQTDPTRNVLNVDNYYISVITDDNGALGMYESLKNPNLLIKGFQPYNSQYTSPEFKVLYYNSDGGKFGNYIGEPKWRPDVNDDSSLLAFYTQNSGDKNLGRDVTFPNYGTYLVKVGKIDPKIISTVNPSTIFSETLGNQFINNQNVTLFSYRAFMGSGEVVAGSPRGFWVDNLGYNLQNKNLLSLKIKNTLDVYLPFIEYGAEKTWGENRGTYIISLFGSFHYFSLTSNEVKALLFLHTIPWQGVKTFAQEINEFLMFDKRVDWKKFEAGGSIGSKKTRVLSIKTLFQAHGGFIHAPKAWVLFIGGILWRLNQNEDPIFYGNKNKTIIDPTYKPNKEQYMYYCAEDGFDDSPDRKPWGLYYGNVQYDSEQDWFNNQINNIDDDNYVLIDKTLRFLPKQIRDEFINYFTNWVNSQDGFIAIQNELELFKNVNQLDLAFDDLINKVSTTEVDNIKTNKISLNTIYQHIDKNIVDNYDLIAPSEGGLRYNFTTVLKPNTSVMNTIVSLLITPTVIQNVNPNIWNYNPYNEYNSGVINNELGKRFGYEGEIGSTVSPSKSIRVRGDKMRTFIDSFHAQLIAKKEDFLKEKVLTEDDITNIQLFGTSDDKSIKLQIYRTLSSINDKWLNGTKDSNIFTQCGAGGVNRSHLEHSKKYRTNSDNIVSLIDTFRFVDRTFKDIGDKFFIDINKVTNLIKGQYNVSFFDVANQILSDNNFNFIPLPNFINFNDVEDLEDIFKPYSYNNEVTFDGTGPAFICCYVGQTSTNLDLGLNSAYPDDGLSITREDNFKDLPDDFNGIPDTRNGDMYAPVFAVNYGQQNQNYFKNVKLDQREFAETMESLEIIEALSQTGDKSKATFAGNNLFNVYKTRSYSAEVEMMGSAMIQPMMYFQLNNIPMFRGAYLIYKVNHKITPHNMVTRFKGNRVKKTKTPLLDEATMYMNLVGTQSGGIIGGSTRVSNSALPIVKTLIDNGINNGYIDFGKTYGYITTKKLIGNSDYIVQANNPIMITEATNSLELMLKDFISWMKGQGYIKNEKHKSYVRISSLYRSYDAQANLNSSIKAQAGTSYHGWGLAVDMFWVKNKTGEMTQYNEKGSTRGDFDLTNGPATKWLYDNSYKYGFINPSWARDGSNYDELWHWEYHGKSAKCLINKSQTVVPASYKIPINVSDEYKSIVKNPKTPNGVEDDYSQSGCESIKIKRADGTQNCPAVIKEPKLRQTSNSVYTKLKQKTQLNDFAIAGIMGNLFAESNFITQSFNVGGAGCGAYGIGQWRSTRQEKLANYADVNNLKIDSLDAQIGFLSEELKSTFPYTFNALKTANTVDLATKIVHNTYELTTLGTKEFNVSLVNENKLTYKDGNGNTKTAICPKERITFANDFYNKIKNNTI
jgi:LAS superfamily LD-carboxypeptidase LdcB